MTPFQRSRSKMLMMAAAMGLALTAGASRAHAQSVRDWSLPAHFCQPVSAHVGIVEYSIFGVHNVSTTTTASVFCPLATSIGEKLTPLTVYVYDRSSTEGVSCDLFEGGIDGFPTFVANRSTGVAFNSPGSQPLSWDPLTASPDGAVVNCTIPKQTSIGFSHVAVFKYITTP